MPTIARTDRRGQPPNVALAERKLTRSRLIATCHPRGLRRGCGVGVWRDSVNLDEDGVGEGEEHDVAIERTDEGGDGAEVETSAVVFLQRHREHRRQPHSDVRHTQPEHEAEHPANSHQTDCSFAPTR